MKYSVKNIAILLVILAVIGGNIATFVNFSRTVNRFEKLNSMLSIQLESCRTLVEQDNKTVEVVTRFVNDTIGIIESPEQLVVSLFTGEFEKNAEDYGFNVGKLRTYLDSEEMKRRGDLIGGCNSSS